MNKKLSIAIVGCGTAGPTAALLLREQGHAVTLFERASTLDWIGAGFMIQPTGLHVLERLGLLAPVVASGARLRGLRCDTRSGKTLMDLHYSEIGDLFAVGLHRAVLLEVLTSAMGERGVDLQLGCEVVGVEEGMLLVSPTNDSDRRRIGPFDLIIGADGSRSKMRDLLPFGARVRPYSWGALWHMTALPSCPDYLSQVVDGTSRLVGVLPTGTRLGSNDTLASLFWSLHADGEAALRTRGLAAWKSEVCELMPDAAPLLEPIDSMDDLTFARYWDVQMKSWHRGNMVLIGDAAHATSPQLGQGVNLGMWDAMVLADSVREAGSIAEALYHYQQTRKHHLRYYQWATRFLTHFFQSHSRTLGGVRDVGMLVANSIGPLRRAMVTTMAGLKRGFVRPSIACKPLRLLAPPVD